MPRLSNAAHKGKATCPGPAAGQWARQAAHRFRTLPWAPFPPCTATCPPALRARRALQNAERGDSPAILPEAGARGCPLQGCSHSVSNLRPGRCPQWVPPHFHVLLMVTLWELKLAGSKHTFPGNTWPPLGWPEEVWGGWEEQNSESSPAVHCMGHQHCVSVNLWMGTGRFRFHPTCPHSLSKASSEETVTRTIGGSLAHWTIPLSTMASAPSHTLGSAASPWQSVQGPNSVETGLLTSTRPSSPLFPGTLVTHSLGNSLASLCL